jgi:hypothetical protein
MAGWQISRNREITSLFEKYLLWWQIARLTPNARCRDLKAVGQLTSKGVSVEVVEGDALCRL